MCTPASTALFACPGLCPGYVPAYPPGGDTSAGSFGNGRFLRPIKSVPRLRIPVLCDAHARLFRVTSVFTK